MDPDLKMPQLFHIPLRVLSLHHRKPKRFVTFRLSQDLMCQAIAPQLKWSLAASADRQNDTHERLSRRLPNWEKEKATVTPEKGSRLSNIKGVPNWFNIPLVSIKNSPETFLNAIMKTLAAIAEADPKWKWVSLISPTFVDTVKQLLVTYKKNPDNVLFDDLVGIDATKSYLKMVSSILQGTRESKKLQADLPYGLLLYGSQGTGKTTLVHALAREARVSFFPVLATDIVKDGPKSIEIKSLFVEARAYSPSIVFIEDVDVIAKIGEPDPSLRQLQSEMEKCKKDGSMVMVIVSTNTLETLDLALTTRGQFSNRVHMGLPDEDSRRKIVRVHLNKVVRERDRELICNLVASRTHGLVWVDIINIADESKRIALSRGADHVGLNDVLHALEPRNAQ